MKKLIRSSESIFGMATVGRHEKPNFLVAVNPDGNRIGEAYFKYYDSNRYEKAEHVARLSFTEPRKIIHKNEDGKLEWDLDSHAKRDICKYLDLPSKQYRSLGVTNWQMALFHWNNEYGLLEADYTDEYDSVVEAFINGFFDTEENLNNASYVPSTLKRPDYTKLP